MTKNQTHEFDDDWETRARETLADVEYDTDLGIEIARDAHRVSEGALSTEAFNEKYRDRLIEEFGMDARPTVDDGPDRPPTIEELRSAIAGAGKELPAQFPESDDEADVPGAWRSSEIPADDNGEDDGRDVSRRSMLKSTGAAAGTLTIGTYAHRNPGGLWGDDGDDEPSSGIVRADEGDVEEDDVRLGMVIDTDACQRVARCVIECEQENNTSAGALWQFTFSYEDEETGDTKFQPRPCQHCSNPPCRDVCPVRARHKRDKDGIVLTDYELCIGCRYCQVACPYGINYFQWGEPTNEADGFEYGRYDESDRMVAGNPPEKGMMGKCTFCVHRQDADVVDNGVEPEKKGTTACEQACPQNVFHFGDLNDPDSKPRRYLREKKEELDDIDRVEVSTWKFKESYGTRPNVIYLGDQPGEEAEWSHEPNPYGGVGVQVDGRDWSLWGDE